MYDETIQKLKPSKFPQENSDWTTGTYDTQTTTWDVSQTL